MHTDGIAGIKGKVTVFVAKNGLHITPDDEQDGTPEFRAGSRLYQTVKGKKTAYSIR